MRTEPRPQRVRTLVLTLFLCVFLWGGLQALQAWAGPRSWPEVWVEIAVGSTMFMVAFAGTLGFHRGMRWAPFISLPLIFLIDYGSSWLFAVRERPVFHFSLEPMPWVTILVVGLVVWWLPKERFLFQRTP